MTKKPRAFPLDDPDVAFVAPGGEPGNGRGSRVAIVEDTEPAVEREAPGAPLQRRRAPWLGILVSALLGLVLLALGLWAERLIADLLHRYPALGWIALGLAGAALAAFLVLVIRETLGIVRERRIERLKASAVDAASRRDDAGARRVIDEMIALYAGRPETARARETIASLTDAIIDPPDRLAIAERELLLPLDRAAKRIVAGAVKQVSLVTTVSPRAIVDVAFVLYVSFRLVRQLAGLYGGRPGFFGFIRLARNVLGHLAVTGGVAAGDSLIQQAMGLGLAARVSAKLGEGVLNGLLTARVGLAAIAVCRPMPFAAVLPPAIADVAGSLFERKVNGA